MINWRRMKGHPTDREVMIYDPTMDFQASKGVMTGSFDTALGKWYAGGGCFPTPTRWAYMPRPPDGAPQT